MRVGRVVGTVVSTICSPVFEGRRGEAARALMPTGTPARACESRMQPFTTTPDQP